MTEDSAWPSLLSHHHDKPAVWQQLQTHLALLPSKAFDMLGECLVSQPMSKAAATEDGFDDKSDTLRGIRYEL
jgi:hypothetical protein